MEDNKAFEVKHHPGTIYQHEINRLAQNYDYVVIDAPPALGHITRSILAVTDLAVIPLSPSPLDVWSCWKTLELIKEVQQQNTKLKSKLLISRKIPGTRLAREAREAMGVFNTDLFDAELCQRVAYIESMTHGVSVMQYAPNSKAANEIERLSEELIPQKVIEYEQSPNWSGYVNQPAWQNTSGS